LKLDDEIAINRAILIDYRRWDSSWNSLISSDWVKGIKELKSLVIQGCFSAFSEVYLSIGEMLQSFKKKSLAKDVN
jgi:hypothetical protein